MVPYSRIKDSPDPWNTEKHRAISRQMALESVVLLKNEGKLLPLNKNAIKSIAVIGPLADSVHWDWYGGTPPYAITPLQGIKEEAGAGITVNYAENELGAAALAAARKSDVAIVVVGNDPTCGPDMGRDWIAGDTLPCTSPSDGREGRDRESIDLYQEQLVKQVRRESEDSRGSRLELSVRDQLEPGPRAGDPPHGPLFAGRRHGARAGSIRRL